MASTTNDGVDSVEEGDFSDVRKCRVHGLLFDAEIAESCPLCEYERADRLADAVRPP